MGKQANCQSLVSLTLAQGEVPVPSVSHVILPEMNGRGLADAALKLRTDFKTVFTSGYTRNAIVQDGVLDPGTHLISKPFTLPQIAAKLDAVLHAQPNRCRRTVAPSTHLSNCGR